MIERCFWYADEQFRCREFSGSLLQSMLNRCTFRVDSENLTNNPPNLGNGERHDVSYCYSICTESDDLGWPWTIISRYFTEFGSSGANYVKVVEVYTVCDKNVAQKSSFRQYTICGDIPSDYRERVRSREVPYSTAKIRLVQRCAAILATAELSALSSLSLSWHDSVLSGWWRDAATAADWRASDVLCAYSAALKFGFVSSPNHTHIEK